MRRDYIYLRQPILIMNIKITYYLDVVSSLVLLGRAGVGRK